MKAARAAALVAAGLVVALAGWLLGSREPERRARSTGPRTTAVEPATVRPLEPGPVPKAAVPGPEPGAEVAEPGPLDLSFHLESGAGAIRVELSIRPEEQRVHLKAAGSSLLGSVGRGSGSSDCEFSYRGRAFRAELAWDDAMRLERLHIRGDSEPAPDAETLLDLFAGDGKTLAAERPPAVLDPKAAAYVLERRRHVANGVARDLVATLKPAE